MAERVVELAITKFPGVDYRNSLSREPGLSPDCGEVWGDGTFLAARPGISTPITSAGTRFLVYDLIPVALRLTATENARHGLFMIYVNSVSSISPRSAFIDLTTNTVHDLGGVSDTTDPERLARFVPAGRNVMFVTPQRSEANWYYVNHFQATAPYYRNTAVAAWDTTRGFAVGVWNRAHLFLGYADTPDAAHLLRFSDFNAPLTSAAANTTNLDEKGWTDPLAGAFRIGDAVYVGKVDGVYQLTGSDVTTFRLERARARFGFAGMRSWTTLDKGVAIGFVMAGAAMTQYVNRQPARIEGVGLISGLDGEEVGGPIANKIKKDTALFNAASTAWAKDWPSDETVPSSRLDDMSGLLSGTLLAPIVSRTPTAQYAGSGVAPMFFRDRSSGSYWPWSTRISISSFHYLGGRMYLGCGDGHIRHFDSSQVQDDSAQGANVSPYWWSSPITSLHLPGVTSRHKISLQWVAVYGDGETGQDTMRVVYKLNGGPQLPNPLGPSKVLSRGGTDFDINAPEAHSVQIGLLWPGQSGMKLLRVTRIEAGFKVLGR